MTTGDRILKAIFEVGLAVDTVDQILEEQIDDVPEKALRFVAQATGDWWREMELIHQRLHGEYDIPMNPEYCAEDPRLKIGLREWGNG